MRLTMMNNDRIYYSRNTEMHAMRAMFRLTLLCLAVGLAIGAVLALLFAPATGKKIREGLAKTVEDGLQTGREAVEPMVKQLEKDFDALQKNVEKRVN
jgi:gas vesicle protein